MGTAMGGLTVLTSGVVPLLVDNIDTDQIIPARFLKTIDKRGLGDALFCDWRYDGDVPDLAAPVKARPKADFPLNLERYSGAQVLLAGDNFGCGSSREHAPWALAGWGFRAVIATTFADIFRSNALKNALLPVEVDAATHAELVRLAAAADYFEVTLDLTTQELRLPGGVVVEFPIDAFSKRCLIGGLDQLGYLLSFSEQIARYEERKR